LGLLQGWLDIGAMGILSLLCFIWAGRTLLGFCLLTCTFISLISSGSGLDEQQFQPCKQALPVVRQFFFAPTEQQSAVFYSPTFVPADEHRQALMKDFFSNNLLSTSVPNNSSLTNFLFQKSKKKPSTQHSVWRKCGRGF
jgi:hypothetical protein